MVILTHFLAPDVLISNHGEDFHFNSELHPFVVERTRFVLEYLYFAS